MIGSVVGLGLAVWLSRTLVALAPSTLPRLHEIGLDARVLLFTCAITVVTALLCGILPALELSRPRGEALKEGARTSTGRRERRIFGALVATQLAIAVVLLVGGGLLLRSFSKLMAVDPGFRAERVLTLATSLPAGLSRRGKRPRLLLASARRSLAGAWGQHGGRLHGAAAGRARAARLRSNRNLPRPVNCRTVRPHQWVAGRYFEPLASH